MSASRYSHVPIDAVALEAVEFSERLEKDFLQQILALFRRPAHPPRQREEARGLFPVERLERVHVTGPATLDQVNIRRFHRRFLRRDRPLLPLPCPERVEAPCPDLAEAPAFTRLP